MHQLKTYRQRRRNGEEQVLDLVFYERNGLRHGQFNTRLNPETETIESLTWSPIVKFYYFNYMIEFNYGPPRIIIGI